MMQSFKTLRARRANAPADGVRLFNFVVHRMSPELVQIVYDLANQKGQFDPSAAAKLSKLTGVSTIWIKRRNYLDLWMDLGAEVYKL
jgi:hypothetical protein